MTEKHVIITGGSKGIGKAIVEECAQDGLKPVCVARSRYQGVCADQVLSITCDLSDPDGPRKCFEELDARKISATHLVNNAGALEGKHLHTLTLEEIELQIQMNTRLPILMSREFLLRLGAGAELRNGVIVNIYSISALSTSSDPVYGATKAAVSGLTRCLALHYGPNVRVNAVAPGFTPSTEMGLKVPADRAKGYIENSRTKKELLPESVAEMVCYLMSNKAINITGVTYEVCNGTYLR